MFYKNLDRIREKHEFELEKMKLIGELQIEKDSVKKDIELNQLRVKKTKLELDNEIWELKNTVKSNTTLIQHGKALAKWAFLATLVSTCLTVAGLWELFNNTWFMSAGMVFAVVVTQFTVYLLSKQDTNIKANFVQHAFKCSLLKVVLLSISIYGNYTFFTKGREINFMELVTTIALCICIDVISIFILSISQDFKNLNKNVERPIKKKSVIFEQICFILTGRITNKIEEMYVKTLNTQKLISSVQDRDTNKELTYSSDTENCKLLTSVQDRDAENELTYKDNSKKCKVINFDQDRDLVKLKNAILNYKDNNICPPVTALEQLTGFTKNKIIAMKKVLENDGFIETIKDKTIVKEEAAND